MAPGCLQDVCKSQRRSTVFRGAVALPAPGAVPSRPRLEVRPVRVVAVALDVPLPGPAHLLRDLLWRAGGVAGAVGPLAACGKEESLAVGATAGPQLEVVANGPDDLLPDERGEGVGDGDDGEATEAGELVRVVVRPAEGHGAAGEDAPGKR